MVGKLVVIALACVSFAQGFGLEDAIRRGLATAENLDRNGNARIEAALKEVTQKNDLIQGKTDNYVQRADKMREAVEKELRNTARATEEKAKESNAPNSVFECIKRVEENGNNLVESFTKKFQADMRRLEGTKLANIKTDTKPLGEMGEALEVRYERAVRMIKSCQNERCVAIDVRSFATWLDAQFADIKRIMGQVSTIYGNFQRDANTFYQNTNRQVSRVRGSSGTNIRRCLYSREAIFGQN